MKNSKVRFIFGTFFLLGNTYCYKLLIKVSIPRILNLDFSQTLKINALSSIFLVKTTC
jgi:hypothetical protein